MQELFDEYGGLIISILGAGIGLVLFSMAFISKDFMHLSPVGEIMNIIIGGLM